MKMRSNLKEIKSLAENIYKGVQNLKERTDYNVLLYKDKLWLVETGINKFRSNNEIEGLRHALNIFQETAGLRTEGERGYDNSIWDANIQARGKMTTLEELFSELKSLVTEYIRNK